MKQRFEVDGIVYDQATQDRPSVGGTYFEPGSVPPIPEDECLCGTGFVCLAHPEKSRGQLTWGDDD